MPIHRRRAHTRPKVRLLYDDITFLFEDLKAATPNIEVKAYITSEGPASAYALVWEFGNLRQTKQGPKTVLGVNPNGETVWLSSQAPTGYIRTLAPEFRRIIREELAQYQIYLEFGRNIGFEKRRSVKSQMLATRRLEKVAERITNKMLRLLRRHVPVDTGDLKDSLRVYVNSREVVIGDVE